MFTLATDLVRTRTRQQVSLEDSDIGSGRTPGTRREAASLQVRALEPSVDGRSSQHPWPATSRERPSLARAQKQ